MLIHANRFRILSSDNVVSIRMDIGSLVSVSSSSSGEEYKCVVVDWIDDVGLDEVR